jgi:hypothetical protein
MGNFHERYCEGECEQVWEELLAYGDNIRREHLFADAMAVAQETMLRVRENIQTLITRLHSIDYQFRNPEYAHVAPKPDVQNHLARLEQIVGPIPLSLRAWYEVVGSVDLTGSHLNFLDFFDLAPLPDPLATYSIERVVALCVQEYGSHGHKYHGSDKMFMVPIGPDEYRKVDMSGGDSYEIVAPNHSADALLLNSWHKTTFIGYLRVCLRWGGFAGFEDANTRPEGIDTVISRLTQGLQQI